MGLYKRGACLGPPTAFLYSGPAINVLAIILPARVLGWEIGVARALGAVLFSAVIGVQMAAIFRGEETERQKGFGSNEGDQAAIGVTRPISIASNCTMPVERVNADVEISYRVDRTYL